MDVNFFVNSNEYTGVRRKRDGPLDEGLQLWAIRTFTEKKEKVPNQFTQFFNKRSAPLGLSLWFMLF